MWTWTWLWPADEGSGEVERTFDKNGCFVAEKVQCFSKVLMCENTDLLIVSSNLNSTSLCRNRNRARLPNKNDRQATLS